MNGETQNPAPTPPPPTKEEIRIQQLEGEMSSRERLATAAEREINRVWEAYAKVTKPITTMIIIAVAILAGLGIKSYTDIKEMARTAAESEVSKVRGDIKEELERRFAKPEIQALINQAARDQVDAIAEPLVSALLKTNIIPLMSRTSSRIEQLNLEIGDATNSLQALRSNSAATSTNLQQIADFYSLALRAQNDDRYAFWQLKGIADSTNSNNELAKRVVGAINSQLALQAISLSTIDAGAILEASGFNFQTNTLEAYKLALAKTSNIERIAFLRAMHHQDRFPLKGRLEVLSVWISSSPSLLVQDEACRLMNEQAKINFNAMVYPQYLDWYSNWSKTNAVSKP